MASVLPVVTVKDPFTWFPSICRHPYAVRLSSKQRTKCPRPLDAPVSVAYQKSQVLYYESLVDLWSRWHGEYYEAKWPRLLVRFEDLLFEPRAVAGAVCDCLGGALCGNQPVRRRVDGVEDDATIRTRRKILVSTQVAPSHPRPSLRSTARRRARARPSATRKIRIAAPKHWRSTGLR